MQLETVDPKGAAPVVAEPRTLGLAHLLLQTSDITRAERFYVGVLGFSVRKRERFDETRPLIVTHQGLGITEGGPGDGRQVEHIAFRVHDVRGLAARIRDADVPILEELGPGAYGMTIYVADPDGNKIELFEQDSMNESNSVEGATRAHVAPASD